jgi:hypothetical protein
MVKHFLVATSQVLGHRRSPQMKDVILCCLLRATAHLMNIQQWWNDWDGKMEETTPSVRNEPHTKLSGTEPDAPVSNLLSYVIVQVLLLENGNTLLYNEGSSVVNRSSVG